MNSDSDTSYIPAIIGFFVAIIAIFAAFFLIGPIVGIVVLIAVLAIAVFLGYRLMSQNED